MRSSIQIPNETAKNFNSSIHRPSNHKAISKNNNFVSTSLNSKVNPSRNSISNNDYSNKVDKYLSLSAVQQEQKPMPTPNSPIEEDFRHENESLYRQNTEKSSTTKLQEKIKMLGSAGLVYQSNSNLAKSMVDPNNSASMLTNKMSIHENSSFLWEGEKSNLNILNKQGGDMSPNID